MLVSFSDVVEVAVDEAFKENGGFVAEDGIAGAEEDVVFVVFDVEFDEGEVGEIVGVEGNDFYGDAVFFNFDFFEVGGLGGGAEGFGDGDDVGAVVNF